MSRTQAAHARDEGHAESAGVVALSLRRVAALLADTVLFFLLAAGLILVADVDLLNGWGPLLVAVIFWLAVSLPQSALGATPGKALFGLRVQWTEGGGLPLRLSLIRNSWMLVGALPAIGEALEIMLGIVLLLSMVRGVGGRGLHDRLSEAEVRRR
jgi:uncharacterized RDD family membrane protein YckC